MARLILMMSLGLGASEGPAKEPLAGSDGDNRWALLIGVSRYDDPRLVSLAYASSDAEALGAVLAAPTRGGFARDHVLLVSDSSGVRPTHANVLREVEKLREKATGAELVLVFFSGHAVVAGEEVFLLMQDSGVASGEVVRRTGLALDDLEAAMTATGAPQRVLLFDGCRAARGGKSGMSRAMAERLFRPAEGRAVLASTDADKVAFEDAKCGHGVFTCFLLDALTGRADADRDGRVGLVEAQRYLAPRVEGWALGKGVGQKPRLLFDVAERDVVLVRVPDDPHPTATPARLTIVAEAMATDVPAPVVTPATVRTRCPQGMVLIPAGTFRMGSEAGVGAQDEHPAHQVHLDAFCMDVHEVSNAEFEAFVRDTRYVTMAEKDGKGTVESRPGLGDWALRKGFNWRRPRVNALATALGTHPVVQVAWEDAREYCRWRRARLPHEAEWEKACRGGLEGRHFPWGNEVIPRTKVGNLADESIRRTRVSPYLVRGLPSSSNAGMGSGGLGRQAPDWVSVPGYNDGYTFSAPVASFEPNGYGLFDMSGNVWEWVGDCYDEAYYGISPAENPTGPGRCGASGKRVARGGSWVVKPQYLRCAARAREPPDARHDTLGFRCAADPR